MTDDLEACGGGGWTLVMKINGNKVSFFPPLLFKASPVLILLNDNTFLFTSKLKSFSYELLRTRPRFEKEA